MTPELSDSAPDLSPEVPRPAPRFEIVREGSPRRGRSRTLPLFGALFGAIRRVVESGYVSVAQEVMSRTEQLEDARAERRFVKRTHAIERRRRRQARRRSAAPTCAPARPESPPAGSTTLH